MPGCKKINKVIRKGKRMFEKINEEKVELKTDLEESTKRVSIVYINCYDNTCSTYCIKKIALFRTTQTKLFAYL